MVKHTQVVEFNEIFPEENPQNWEEELRKFLTGIPRSKIIDAVTHFLGLKNNVLDKNRLFEFLKRYISKENVEFAHLLWDRIIPIIEQEKVDVSIINPASMLKLLEFAHENLLEEETQSWKEAEQNIFKAIFLLNQEVRSGERIARKTTENVEGRLRQSCYYISAFYPYHDLSNRNLRDVITAQFIKIVLLFEFLETREDASAILKAFLNYYECNTWREFLKELLSIPVAVLKPQQDGSMTIDVLKDENYEANCRFLEKLAIPSSDIHDVDFRIVRGNPLIYVGNGKYRVIYGLFTAEMIFKSQYFVMSRLHGKLSKEDRVNKEFKSFWSNDYSEQYLLNGLMDSIYGKRKYIRISGDECKKKYDMLVEPDYYMRNGNCQFLFESKDFLIKADDKNSFNYAIYEYEFKKRLYQYEESGKSVNGAVMQLITNVERSLTLSFPFDNNYKQGSVRVYPIIVIHDYQYNLVGLNNLVNHWFNIELNKLGEKGLDVSGVRNVIIMDIDTLILYHDILESKKIQLNVLIDEYLKVVKLDEAKKYKTKEVYIKAYTSQFIPFFNYLLYQHPLTSPTRLLQEKGISLFSAR